MSINRAPKGVPAGGQFVAGVNREPSISLERADLASGSAPHGATVKNISDYLDRNGRQGRPSTLRFGSDLREAGGPSVTEANAGPRLTVIPDLPDTPAPRNLGIASGGARIIDWNTKDPVSYNSVTPVEMAALEQLSAESGVAIPTAPLLTSFKRRGHREIGTRSSRVFDFTDFKYLHSDDLTADERELMADLLPDILAQEQRDTQGIPAVGRSADGVEDRQPAAPAATGAFVAWGQMLPAFLRRQNRH
jgi:hypothetical protein